MSREHYENLPSTDLAKMIRTAMGEGCIRPIHVYDMVDVLLSRIEEPAGRVEAALAEPPRNCDRFNTGDVEQDADAALRAMLDEMKSDGNFGYRGVASYLLSPVRNDATVTPEAPKTPETSEAPKGGEICGDNRFELIESAKKELLRCTNIEGSPDEMAVLDSLLFRMWQMRWLPGCERRDAAATAEAAEAEAKPAPAGLFPKGVRPATEAEVEAGDAQWCEVCRMTCPCKGKDILVHGCSQASPKDSLS